MNAEQNAQVAILEAQVRDLERRLDTMSRGRDLYYKAAKTQEKEKKDMQLQMNHYRDAHRMVCRTVQMRDAQIAEMERRIKRMEGAHATQ